MSSYQGNILIKNPATPTGPAEDGTAPGIWKLNEALAFVKQGIWPTQGVQGRDPYFPYVSLLLSTTSLGNANNNLFVDSSGAFNPISRNGNTTQGSVTPYGANWSNYFDGSGDFLSVPSNAAFSYGTGDFTMEAWVYKTASGDRAVVDSATTGGGTFGFLVNDTQVVGYQTNVVAYTFTYTVPRNTWTHIAFVRTGGNLVCYVNGTSIGSQANSANFTSSNTIAIGRNPGSGGSQWQGYISNLRIVKGTAVYTASFTPPTTPLTAISGTSLLTCQSNRFRDASTNNFTITVNGNTSVTDFSPFAPASPGIVYDQSDITNWSGYFDGNGDYLTVPSSSAFNYGTGDFTIECWGYRGSSSNFWCAYSASGVSFTLFSYAGASETIQVYSNGFYNSGINPGFNTWFHVAVTRSSGTLRIFINGVQGFSGSYTTNIPSHGIRIGSSIAGEWGLGNVSNLRVVKGTAVYTSAFTPPTTNLTAISGTSLLICQNAAFTDNSTNNFVVTINGNTTVTGNSPFQETGLWSLAGTSTQGATIPQTTATDLGSGSFTVECWVNTLSYDASFVTKRRTDTALTGSWMLAVNPSGFFTFQGVGWASSYQATTNAIPVGAWTHLAVSRSGTNLSMFVNGVRVYNVTDSYNYTCSTYTIIKLAGNSGGNYPSGGALFGGHNGSISNLRIVQGTAVYNPASTTLTVPTSPLTAISGTSLLTCQNGTMKDNSANNNTSILLYGGGSIQSFNPFYTSTIASNGGSMYFDGTSDWLSAPNSVANFGAGSFTAECWVYFNSNTAGYQPIMDNAGTADRQGWAIILETNNTLNAYTSNGSNWTWNTTTSYVPPAKAWLHIALVRNGATMTLYANGVSLATSNISTNAIHSPSGAFYAGYYPYFPGGARSLNGYMADVRLTPGTALYTSAFTPPTAPLTPSANTRLLLNGMNAGAYDATAINDMETVGNAQVSTAVSKFGGSSVYFDGTGDYLTSNAASDLYAFGTGDFTIEMWFNLSSVASLQILYDSRPTSTDGLYPLIYVASGGGSVIWQISAVARITGTATLSTGVWYHIAVSRSSGSTKMFLNGTQIGSTYADTNAYLNSGTTRPFIGGSSYTAGTLTVNGYIDDLRITKGVARYTSNFTPPTQAFLPY